MKAYWSLPVGRIAESIEEVWMDSECFRLELAYAGANNRSEHIRSQYVSNSQTLTNKEKCLELSEIQFLTGSVISDISGTTGPSFQKINSFIR